MPTPQYGGALSIDGRCLSVRLSVCVCPLPDLKSCMEADASWKLAGRKPV